MATLGLHSTWIAVNNMENQAPRNRVDEFPPNNASVDEWIAWGLKVIAKLKKMSEHERSRIKQVRKIRKELKHKKKVLGYYKKTIRELEEKNMAYEESYFFKIHVFLYSLFKKKHRNNQKT